MEWPPARSKAIFLVVIVLAAALRLPALTERPMHGLVGVHGAGREVGETQGHGEQEGEEEDRDECSLRG